MDTMMNELFDQGTHMKTTLRRLFTLIAILTAVCLALPSITASAHSVAFGYKYNTNCSVALYLGTYHTSITSPVGVNLR